MASLRTARTLAVTLAAAGTALLATSQAAAFLLGHPAQQPHPPTLPPGGAAQPHNTLVVESPGRQAPTAASASLGETLGARGLFCYGLGFGVLAALVHGGARVSRGVARRAADIEVADKTETKPLKYFESFPPSLVNKKTMDMVLSGVPREQWDDPPEDSPLYAMKLLAETYGEGKATKMAWWDYFYLKNQVLPAEYEYEYGFFAMTGPQMELWDAELALACSGKIPLQVPGPAFLTGTGLLNSGATIQWRGPEMFAGDQTMTPLTDGKFTKDLLSNLAFYREGLKPWQRGLEIGISHGYFIIGPFVSLGPLRNTPEAATVGLLAGVATLCIVTAGAFIFGQTIKPTLFDKVGDKDGTGWTELVNWFLLGGIGGAGFAHALIAVFGSV